MNTIKSKFNAMVNDVPPHIKREVDMEFAISNRIESLMREKNISKVELARATGKRPNEITRWLSGQHNFTIRTLSLLSAYFGTPLINIEE